MYKDYQKGGTSFRTTFTREHGVRWEAVPKGVDNLRQWSNDAKPVVADIEGSNINDTTRPTPAQIKSESVDGARPRRSRHPVFLSPLRPDLQRNGLPSTMRPPPQESRASTRRSRSLAPVLNTQSVGNDVTVASSDTSSRSTSC